MFVLLWSSRSKRHWNKIWNLFFFIQFNNICFDWRSHRVFFCVESFFMLHILVRSFLMVSRDGKWQLPVIYNRSTSNKAPTLDWHKTPTQAIFTRELFITYALSLFYFYFFLFACLLSLLETFLSRIKMSSTYNNKQKNEETNSLRGRKEVE